MTLTRLASRVRVRLEATFRVVNARRRRATKTETAGFDARGNVVTREVRGRLYGEPLPHLEIVASRMRFERAPAEAVVPAGERVTGLRLEPAIPGTPGAGRRVGGRGRGARVAGFVAGGALSRSDGIERGDHVVSVNGRDTRTMDFEDLAALVAFDGGERTLGLLRCSCWPRRCGGRPGECFY